MGISKFEYLCISYSLQTLLTLVDNKNTNSDMAFLNCLYLRYILWVFESKNVFNKLKKIG